MTKTAFFAFLAATSIPVPAEKPITMTWISRPCELLPISPWNYRYEACEDTTGYITLNRALALRLDGIPEFDKYRLYRSWENAAQIPLAVGIAILSLDVLATRFAGPLCSTSFSSACSEAGPTTMPLQYYLAFFSITIPMNIFTSYKRIGYMNILVGRYNQGLRSDGKSKP